MKPQKQSVVEFYFLIVLCLREQEKKQASFQSLLTVLSSYAFTQGHHLFLFLSLKTRDLGLPGTSPYIFTNQCQCKASFWKDCSLVRLKLCNSFPVSFCDVFVNLVT